MRKMLLSAVAIPALALAGGIAAPKSASADVDLLVTITKDVDLVVNEYITKDKYVDIYVDADFVLDHAAEAMAVVNAANEDNVVDGYDGAGVLGGNDIRGDAFADYAITRHALVESSINWNSGIVGVNVDVGNNVNQGNVVSFSLTGGTDTGSLAHSQAEIEQRNLRNSTFDSEFLDAGNGPGGFAADKSALVVGSVNGNMGITGLNVNTGNFNNQHNVVALAVGFDALVALSEAALGQENSGNHVTEIETVKYGAILGSANGNTGIVGINVSNGNSNNQASVVSFSALTSTAVVGVPGS